MGQHINTFENGMTSDVNILYQPDGTYRFMKNCSLISQDGNNFVVKDCLGNQQMFQINRRYATINPASLDVTYDSYPMVIGFISFPDRLIVLSTNAESVDSNGNTIGGYGEIGEIKYIPYGEGIQPELVFGAYNNGYTPLYHNSDLNFSKLQRIEGFAFPENDSIQRIYWTDFFNEPRVLNVGDPLFTTYISSGSLVINKQYMVLEGIIEHPIASTLFYGPGLPLGNTFTATTTTYSGTTNPSPIAKVIEYYPLQLLNFTPSRALGNIKFLKYGVGQKYCGSKIYFYRLTRPQDGIATSWSYGASPIHVGTTNSVVASPSNTYFDFTGGGSATALLNSGKSVFITISNIDTSFTNIEVACAEFDQLLDVPRIISTVISTQITGTSMDLEDTGGNNLGELTLSDITLFPASIIACKTLTTNKNYILIGNTVERTEFIDFDKDLATITQIQHRYPVHQGDTGGTYAGAICQNILSYNSVSPLSTITNPANVNGIQPYTQWVVTAGIVTYNAILYGPGQVGGDTFTGALGVYNWTDTSGTAQVRPCVSRNGYTKSATATPANGKAADWIQFNNALSVDAGDWSYKNPAVESHVKGYWSAQTYRFGILFYDLKGNPFYVRHLKDFTFDTCINIPLLEEIQIDSTANKDWYINQNGISISGITIPAAFIDKISGFSIVRAERDATILTQGILMQTASSASTGGVIRPLCSPYVNVLDNYDLNDRTHIFTYVCPDELVQFPMTNYVSGSSMSLSHYVTPRVINGKEMKSSSDGYEAMETKYFQVKPVEASPDPSPTYKITAIQDIIEDGSVTNFGSGNESYINQTHFKNSTSLSTDPLCFGLGPANLQNCQAVGGLRSIVELEGSVFSYNGYNTVAYGALNAATDDKMIANVTVSKSGLYGGNSDSALANTLYISTGHFQPITTAVKADTIVGSNYIFNNVEVYGGDCYAALIDYGHSLYDVTLTAGTQFTSHSWGIKFACQCNSNYDLRRGRTIGNNRMFPATTGVSYNPVLLEGFSYNKGYSSQGFEFAYPSLPVTYSTDGQFKYRIRFGGQKFPGELIDSFRIFRINDYKDTDGQSGEINNLKTKEAKTIVWQNKAISTVPILERQVVSGTDGSATTIGTGGVVDRFDVINSYFGNQHQWSLTETEYGFFWFDMRRKACVALDINGGIQEVSMVNGLKGFFDEVFLEVYGNLSAVTNVLNSQTYDKTSDRPLVGVGITGVYEPKFKMTYLTFKFMLRQNVIGDGEENYQSYISKDFTIGYYHAKKMFVGFYDSFPAIQHNHNQTIFGANNPKNKDKFYGTGMNSTDFAIGDVIPYLNQEWMCISPVTITNYPGVGNTAPDYSGSTFWRYLNNTSELWSNNQPSSWPSNPSPDYVYDKFFGRVVNNELWFVVNPKTQNPYSVLNIEQKGNNVNVTDIEISGQTQTAADLSISTTSRWYKWIYDRICSNMPLGSTGRITDSYLLVKMTKKNWDIAPYDVSRSVKILQFIKSFFEEKR